MGRVTKLGIEITEGMSPHDKGMAFWGYVPSGQERPKISGVREIFETLRNKEAIIAAKQNGYQGDWAPTRGVLAAVGHIFGVHITSNRPNP